jgi:hypothetical protein
MNGARRFGWPAATALALLGCDPARHVNAHVTSAEECASASGPVQAHPVEGAVVALRCPDGENAILGRTRQDGRFVYSKLGSLNADCTVHVSMKGYIARQYRVGDVCAAGSVVGHCPYVTLQPFLLRSSGTPPAQ